ncbi:YjcZ family sporulation protein [Bacillus sp. FJAT-47783]|nr:YjcZ family sporulation protein [Bacillus sp. FJAT-47783]
MPSYGYPCYDGASSFILVLVLFILLIIVGTAFVKY